ncbi:ATP-binding protein [Mycobacterium sp. 21AC1]|uniref:ATP-binding protein n=1 Tax=[Mycobacterium] appelbergii TaxID=2939269 RepID=UPI00293952A9|nr:ATP-binding protein [Mycobacterium sp. 21AC1]MDV3124365.1 ATP-binding protein [Mycobacterium sp. 21AC1]
MAVDWVIAPRDRALDGLQAGLREHSGVVLLGPDGVGKTSLARAAVDWIGADFDRVAWVTGTESAAAIPFAAVCHLIDVPAVGKTAEVLRAARNSLGSGLLLVVDDAHLLDPLSAALVYQLAVGGNAKLIATATKDGQAAEEVSALWRDGLLRQLDVQPAGHDPARLADQIAGFVEGLPAAAMGVLHYLAVHDPLPRTDLAALTGADALEQAQQCGAVRVDDDAMVHCVHPLFRAAVRSTVGGPGLRRLRTGLVEQLMTSTGTGVVDRLRLAVLALDGDRRLSVGAAAAAADDALRLGDLELSERLGRAAVDDGAGFDTRLTLAYALAWQGRGREADAVLADVDTAALAETELMAWALPRAANQFWMLSEPERATAFLLTIRGRVSSAHAQTTLDALSATFAMNAGAPQRALTIADSVLTSPSADDTGVGWAASAAALSSARMGHFDAVDALAQRALDAGHPGLLRFTTGFGQTTSLLLAGELDRAQTLAQELTDFTELQQPGRAIGEVLMADVLMVRGRGADAAALLRRATAALAPTGYSWGPVAWMLLAQALGQRGRPVEAAKALSRAESRHGLKSMLFAPELALARAWTCFARKDSVGAVTAAREAAKAAERGGQSAVALRAFHDAVRLGDNRAVDGLTRIGLDCPFGKLTMDHARALTAADQAALRDVAAQWAAIGMSAAADDATRQACG